MPDCPFRDADMTKAYALCCKLGADLSSSFWMHGQPNRTSMASEAYWAGREEQVRDRSYKRGTMVYAAYRAGLDDGREIRAMRGKVRGAA